MTDRTHAQGEQGEQGEHGAEDQTVTPIVPATPLPAEAPHGATGRQRRTETA